LVCQLSPLNYLLFEMIFIINLTPQETESILSNDNFEKCDLIDVKSETAKLPDDNAIQDIEDEEKEDIDSCANLQLEDAESIAESSRDCVRQLRTGKSSPENIRTSSEEPNITTREEEIATNSDSSSSVLDEQTENSNGAEISSRSV